MKSIFKTNLPVFLFMSFVSLLSWGHIRVVGGGGGLPELQMLSVDQKMPELLSVYLSQDTSGELTPVQRQSLKNLISQSQTGKKSLLLISQDCLEPKIQIKAQGILISSCALYQGDRPLSVLELTKLVFQIRLREISSGLSESEQMHLSEVIWQNLREVNSESLSISNQPFVAIHTRTLSFGSNLVSFLSL